jgi:hypothetical protein
VHSVAATPAGTPEPSLRRNSPLGTLLYWLLLVFSGAALAVSAILPAWLDYRGTEQIELHRRQVLAQVQQRAELIDRQLEHLQTDPAYIERVAREESRAEIAGVEKIYVQNASEAGNADLTSEDIRESGPHAELAARVDKLVAQTPWFGIFIDSATRPIVLGLSAGVFLVTLILLALRPVSAARSGPLSP